MDILYVGKHTSLACAPAGREDSREGGGDNNNGEII